MEYLSNVILSSVILSVLILITIFYLLNEYEIEVKEYTRMFLYILATCSVFLYQFKKIIIDNHGYTPITAAAEVFNEITDSQQLNGIVTMNRMGGEELIIDNIPNTITCNNIA